VSLGASLQNALSGIQVSQSALNNASNNIANVNTDGYTKKIMGQASRVVGTSGSGVTKTGITRNVDTFLLSKIRNEAIMLGASDARSEYLGLTDDFFGTPSSNIGINALMNDLASSLDNISVDPTDNVARSTLVSRARDLADKINKTALDIQAVRNEIEGEIDTSIDQINTILTRIHSINTDISKNTISGADTATLEDQRDMMLKDLANLVDYSTYDGSNGRISVVIGGSLMVDSQLQTFDYDPQNNVLPGSTFNDIEVNGLAVTNSISGGRLKELMTLRDTDFPNMASQLDELAQATYEHLNTYHNLGTAYPPPNVMTGTWDTGGGATAFTGTGTVRIALTDASGDVLDNAGTPRILDLDMSTITDINDLMTTINTDANLTGQVTVSLDANDQIVFTGAGDNRIAIGELTPVDITTPATTRSFSHQLGLNNFFTADETSVNPGEFAASLDFSDVIEADNSRLAVATLPKTALANIQSGDNLVAIGDASNAVLMAEQMTEDYNFAAAGGIPATARPLSDYAAMIITTAANAVSQAEANTDIQTSIVDNLVFKSAEMNGVSIDEELSEIIVFENAFNASARVISVVNEMLDTLEQAIR